MNNQKIKGTRDYFGIESAKLKYVFTKLEKIAEEFNFKKVITPSMEYTELFSRAVGQETEVVNKQMYTFLDRKGRSLSLRPEGTASVVRSVIENKLIDNNKKPSLYYISSMFRYERPQKGRQREFFQFGVENFGNDSALIDVETIMFAKNILNEFDIKECVLEINSIGDKETREKYNESLMVFIKDKINDLSSSAKEYANSKNIMRIFDTKNESDLNILKDAPVIKDFLSETSIQRFKDIKETLDKQGIEYKVNDKLVRGLDYYNDLVFEFISQDETRLGAKSTIIGGGRYNFLVRQIDSSKDVPAIGFALGIERLMLAAEENLNNNVTEELDYYLATTNEKYGNDALNIAKKLRNKGFKVEINFEAIKLGKKFELANNENAKFIIIIGKEIEDSKVVIKDLSTGIQIEKKIEEI